MKKYKITNGDTDEVIIIGRFYKSQVKEMARQLTNIFTSVRCEVIGE